MKPSESYPCGWCSAPIEYSGSGRPRRYCRRSHRQRSFEARRLGRRMGLSSGEALVSLPALRRTQDRLYALESALVDVERDLRGTDDLEEYRSAFRHLYATAAQLRGHGLEAVAVFDTDDGLGETN